MIRVIEESKDQETLQSDLDKLVKWSESWQMKFNLSKCKVGNACWIGQNQNITCIQNGQELSQIEKEKDLGVFINPRPAGPLDFPPPVRVIPRHDVSPE